MTNVRWGLIWDLKLHCLYSDFFEGAVWEKYPGEVWSMGIAYDTIDSLGEMKLVDIEEEERIMEGNRKEMATW